MAISDFAKDYLNTRFKRVGLGTLIKDSESLATALLTGFVAGAGTIAATDTIVQGFNKIVGNLAAKVPDKSIIASGTFTTAGGDTAESITVAGMLTTDLVFVQVVSGTGYVVSADAGGGAIAVVMSADPGAATVLQYMVLR